MSEDRLEKALNAMRNEEAPRAEADAARRRVLEKLTAPATAACMAFRAELGKYLAGGLAESRRLLVEDHLSRCPECRHELAALRDGVKVIAMPERRIGFVSRWRGWAVAAGLALVALYAGRDRIDSMLAPGGPRATVEMVSGELHTVPEGVLRAGARLDEGQVVRTSTGSRAVLRLADGSSVEVNERTEICVRAAWSGQTVFLQRGDVIVEAAKQRRRSLKVRTFDTVASVKGTVFAVSAGMAGSTVSVVEGAVLVAQPGSEKLVKPGELVASNPAIGRKTVQESVAWSKDAEKYAELLGEFSKIEEQLAAAPSPELRREARLLRYLPPGVVLYAALPNLGGSLRRAMMLSESRAVESATFREWWNSPSARELRDVAERIQSVSPMLGDEIVFVLAQGAPGRKEVPFLMAEIKDGQVEALKGQIGRLLPEGAADGAWRIAGGVLAVSDSQADLAWATSRMGEGATEPFAAEIAKRYERGAGWLVGMDARMMVKQAGPDPTKAHRVDIAGIGGVKHFFFEQRSERGGEQNEATLTFDGERKGVASWLAPAGASGGAAEYIPTDAIVAFSATTREPRQVFDEMMEQAAKADPNFQQKIQELEAKLGIKLGDDVASSFGTDFAIGIERISVPTPGWMAAIEVYRPGTLDGTLRVLVDLFNNELKPEDQNKRISFTQETLDGRTWNTIQGEGMKAGFTWTYDRGYMVAASERALALKAIATRNGGVPLVRTAQFRAQLPGSVDLHPSGFAWVNLRGALETVSSLVQNPALQRLAANREPILVVLNGERERIHVASRTRLTSLILDVMMVDAAGAAKSRNKATTPDVISSH
jgi:hypothetical protein